MRGATNRFFKKPVWGQNRFQTAYSNRFRTGFFPNPVRNILERIAIFLIYTFISLSLQLTALQQGGEDLEKFRVLDKGEFTHRKSVFKAVKLS